MKFGINTLDDFNIEGKTVLCRIDINEPVDKATGKLKDISRIEGSIKTIRELSQKGAKTVLMAHQGSDIEYKNYYTLAPHSEVLSELLGMKIGFIEDVCGPSAINAIKNLRNGEVLLLENVRFMAEEMTIFETKLNLTPQQQANTVVVRKLAPLADLYVCDAFAAAHRAQPTIIAFEEIVQSAMGRLFEQEYSILSGILEAPKHPCVFVLGGAKIQDAFLMMEKVLRDGVADRVLAGGLVGNVMLTAKGVDIGETSYQFIVKNNLESFIERSRALLEKYSDKIILPCDLSYVDTERKTLNVENLSAGGLFVDIGEATAEKFAQEIMKAATVFVNGPMGVFEQGKSEFGTKTIWNALAETAGTTILGGGDSIAATNKYGLKNRISYICTGGGAMIRFLSGEELPAVKALKRATERFGNDFR